VPLYERTFDTVGRRANRPYPPNLRNQPVVVGPEPELTVAYGQFPVYKGILRFRTRKEKPSLIYYHYPTTGSVVLEITTAIGGPLR